MSPLSRPRSASGSKKEPLGGKGVASKPDNPTDRFVGLWKLEKIVAGKINKNRKNRDIDDS